VIEFNVCVIDLVLERYQKLRRGVCVPAGRVVATFEAKPPMDANRHGLAEEM